MPNGIAFDPKGNLVVVNIGSNDVLTFSPAGQLLTTEQATDAGNDGIVVLPDGTKYVSSVRQGAHSSRSEGGADSVGHSNRRVDDLRLEAQSPGNPDERLERDHDRRSERAEVGYLSLFIS